MPYAIYCNVTKDVNLANKNWDLANKECIKSWI